MGGSGTAQHHYHGLSDKPRIRDITGIRIHQLTLPESLSYASKYVSYEEPEGYTLGESSRLTDSPEVQVVQHHFPDGGATYHRRRSSTSTSFPFPSHHQAHSAEKRERRISDNPSYRPKPPERRSTTSSNGTVTPVPQSPSISVNHFTLPRTRVTRPRAPTLAGEALEHTHSPSIQQHIVEEEQNVTVQLTAARLTRCFVVMKLPDRLQGRTNGDEEESGGVPLPRRPNGEEKPSDNSTNGVDKPRRPRLISSTSTSSSSSMSNRTRPSLSTSSSSTSLTQTTSPPISSSPRQRTTSLSSPKKGSTLASIDGKRSNSSSGEADPRVPLKRHPSRLSDSGGSPRLSMPSPRGSFRGTASQNGRLRSTLPNSWQIANGPSSSRQTSERVPKSPDIPFFISPIHALSTHPQFLSLSSETDFASWLTVLEGASTVLQLEVWVEDESNRWQKLDKLGGTIRLDQLRRGEGHNFPSNTIQFTLSSDPKTFFYLPPGGLADHENLASMGDVHHEGKGVVERSIRETRMKKGVGVGGLHQLVNMYAVIADTERGIAEVQGKLDGLLAADADWRRLQRDIAERENRLKWFQDKIGEVGKVTRESHARNTLHRQGLDARRKNLAAAEERDDQLRVTAHGLEEEIYSIENEQSCLLPLIHKLRASHVQTLDSLFPILPLDPANLLYTILSVPLPIPAGPKDPAPPLTLPQYKVDERTTAAALGYVAMILQILSSFSDSGKGHGGLPYPVTCVGSRSLVKDVVSVMQGPRSFPLFAKGVERYRYEYAVFLLNKNIEMLMLESNIRLLDHRHTLPNLKNLLLTLSSPDLPPPQKALGQWGSSTNTFLGSGSASGSRRPSTVWNETPGSFRSPGSSVGKVNNLSSPTLGAGAGVHTPTPAARIKGGRRSMLSRRHEDEVNVSEEEASDLEDHRAGEDNA